MYVYHYDTVSFLQLPEITTTTTRTQETEVEEKPTIQSTVAVEEATPVESPTVTEKVDKQETTVIEFYHKRMTTYFEFFPSSQVQEVIKIMKESAPADEEILTTTEMTDHKTPTPTVDSSVNEQQTSAEIIEEQVR